MNGPEERITQVREWINRMGEMAEVALSTQQDLASRLTPVLNNGSPCGKVRTAEKEIELVPLAAVLRNLCVKMECLIERNQELARNLEI